MISTNLHPWTAKLAWLLGPSLIGAVGWWGVTAKLLQGQITFSLHQLGMDLSLLTVGLAGLGFWLGSLALVSYLVPWRSARWALVAVASLPLLLFFPLTRWTTAAAIITGLGLAWGMEQLADEARNRLTLRPWQMLLQNVPIIITFVLAAVAVLSYQQVRGSAATTDALANRLISQSASLAEQLLPAVYPHYRSGITVDDLIGGQLPTADTILQEVNFNALPNASAQQQAIRDKLQSLGLDPAAFQINGQATTDAIRQQLATQLNQVRADAVSQARDQLGQSFGITLRGNETVHQALVDGLSQKFKPWLERYARVVPIILAVSLFLVLRIFAFLFIWLAAGVGWLLFVVLVGLKVLTKTIQTVPAETLDWGH